MPAQSPTTPSQLTFSELCGANYVKDLFFFGIGLLHTPNLVIGVIVELSAGGVKLVNYTVWVERDQMKIVAPRRQKPLKNIILLPYETAKKKANWPIFCSVSFNP